jgi:hypothetical protein
VAVLKAAGNSIGAGVEATAGAPNPVKLVAAAEGIVIVAAVAAAAGALGAPKVNGAGFATGEGSAVLVLNPDAATACGAVAVTGATGAPKVKGAEEEEGVGAAKVDFGAGAAPLDTRLFSHETHFTDPFGFWTRQVWHFTRSEVAAMAQREDLAGSVAAAVTAIGTTGAGAGVDTGTGIEGANENPTVGATVSLGTGVGAGAEAVPCPVPFNTVSHETHAEAILVFCTKQVGHF